MPEINEANGIGWVKPDPDLADAKMDKLASSMEAGADTPEAIGHARSIVAKMRARLQARL